MSNPEIIASAATLKNFAYDGNNLFTFAEWKSRGYIVQKGQHAFISTKLWKKVTKTDKKTGKTETNFYMVTSHLFNPDQVKPIQELELTAK
jgi:hypothetical protein